MRRGQVALYLLAVLVGLFLIALMNVDAFSLVRGKNRTQNAGDAAAIAAARKQGRLLNDIGALNVRHIVAAAKGDARECDEIVQDQRRLALLGPVEALRLADKAARKNGMPVRKEYAEILRKHVETIRLVYRGGTNERGEPYPEPYPDAWTEYAAAIEDVVSGGLACGADNIEFFGAMGGHYLLTREFYHAVAAPNWCWFHWNAEGLLNSYTSFRDWAPLPCRDEDSFDNSEIFGLHVKAWQGALTDLMTTNEIQMICEKYGERGLTDEQLEDLGLLSDREQTWFLFDASGNGAWGRWFDGLSLAGDDSGYRFPIVGEVRDEYNVRGCAAVCRCVSDVDSVALDNTAAMTWCAAAKPFGTVESFKGEPDVATDLKAFVVPCFSSVRLVALDAVGGSSLCTADYSWITHIREHLAPYLEHGTIALEQGCFYCLQLRTWENGAFREAGVEWLKYYSGTCVRGHGGGGGRGGTSYGH